MISDTTLLWNIDGLEGLIEYLNNSTESLDIVSGDATIIWANKTELNFLGYSSDEYIGQSITSFHIDDEIINDILQRLFAGETISNYPARLRAHDGSIKQVLINSSGYWKDGEFSHTRCFSRDVTDLFDLTEMIEEKISNIRSANTT